MIDKEKVIKGLECCSAMSGDECQKCPYGHECRDTDLPYGMPHLAADALVLLKEHTEIIRCKDCKWYDERISMCDNCGLPREQTFFCADGKRKEGW